MSPSFRAALRRIALLALLVLSSPATALERVVDFGPNPGNLAMYEYLPTGFTAGAPLVVLLHGCTQSSTGFDDETGWLEVADDDGFAVVVAEQSFFNNFSLCFNWFQLQDIERDRGEVASVAEMVRWMIVERGVDPGAVYVVGFSAGGAMAAAALAAYPELFAAGALLSGVPYRCATSVFGSTTCLNPGRDLSPESWGDRVREASDHPGPWPRVSIWQGTADFIVSPSNARELVEQWTDVHGLDPIPDVVDTVAGYPYEAHLDGTGEIVVERYDITGMGHAVTVDPGDGPTQCGRTGAFFSDRDLCAARTLEQRWGLDRRDTEPPQVAITEPPDGGSVEGEVLVLVEAADAVGVVRVDLRIDGTLSDSAGAPPYTFLWDASEEIDGPHTLRAEAVDAAGNLGVDAIGVTVVGGLPDREPPTVDVLSPVDGAELFGAVEVRVAADDDGAVTRVEVAVDGGVIGEAAPIGDGLWSLLWDTSSTPAGVRALSARARDGAGNEAVDADTQVVVLSEPPGFSETFSDLDGDADPLRADTVGWSGDWSFGTLDHTKSSPSGSAAGSAIAGVGCDIGTRDSTVVRTVAVPPGAVLTYWRWLRLDALVNLGTRASFRLRVGGEVVDERSVTFDRHVDAGWVERTVDVAAFAGEQVELALEVSATANVCLAVTAEARVDDLTIAAP